MNAKSKKILTSGIMDKNELVFICNDERICKKVMELANKAYEQGKSDGRKQTLKEVLKELEEHNPWNTREYPVTIQGHTKLDIARQIAYEYGFSFCRGLIEDMKKHKIKELSKNGTN